MEVKNCRVCKGKDLKLIFSLGKQPLANNLPDKPNEVDLYPLELLECQHCGLIQLSYVVPKEKLYDNYYYIPSMAQTYLKHFEELALSLTTRFALKANDLVVDIGGSDGSLLLCFQRLGLSVVNVEPAKNIQSSVTKIEKYFNEETARGIVAKFGKAKLVTATNSFAHIDNLDEYLRALDILLDEEGIFFAQFPDVRHLLKENQFDTIYHEHLSYFTHEPLNHLFASSPLELFKIESSEVHGGSMQIFVKKRDKLVDNFKVNSANVIKELGGYLREQKLQGKRIAAFGAAAKGMVLLYACGLDKKIIDYVADGTPYKIGKFTPGTNIPIRAEEELAKNPPDILLILAWNFKEEIINKVRNMLNVQTADLDGIMSYRKINFVVPIPKVEII